MDINYLLAGIYGEEAARYRFESMCAALIYEEQNNSGTSLESGQLMGLHDEVKGFDKEIQPYSDSTGTIYAVRTTKGDGGLDIIREKDNKWTVYQCKFFKEDSINTASRKKQIKDSLNKSLETARKYGKTIHEWILCVPLDLSNTEREDYWNKFVKEHRTKVKNINIMPKSKINSLLMKHVHIFNFYFSTVKQPISRKKMYDSLKEFNEKIARTSSSVKRPGVNTEIPSLYKITDEYHELFDTYDQLFTLYTHNLRDLFLNMEQLSEQTQKYRQELEPVKIRNDEVGIQRQEFYGIRIDENYAKLDTLGKELNKIIAYLDSIASTLHKI